MKFSLFSRIIFATLVLALTTSAFAANDSHKSSFEISRPHTSERHNDSRGRLHRPVGRLWANGSGKHHAREKSGGHCSSAGSYPGQQSQRHACGSIERNQWRARTQGAAICGEESFSATGIRISQGADETHQQTEAQSEVIFPFEGAGNCSLTFQFQASDLIIHRVYRGCAGHGAHFC